MRHPSTAWIFNCKAAMAGLCMALVLITGSPAYAAPAAAAPDYASAHEATLATLKKLASTKAAIDEAIARDDLKKVEQLHTEVKTQIAQARRTMDMAYLRGAWNSSIAKRAASDMRGRFEGMEILNFILLAMLTGYEYPAKRMPATVKDTHTRLFQQLDIVLAEMQGLNAKLAQNAPAGEKMGRRAQ